MWAGSEFCRSARSVLLCFPLRPRSCSRAGEMAGLVPETLRSEPSPHTNVRVQAESQPWAFAKGPQAGGWAGGKEDEMVNSVAEAGSPEKVTFNPKCGATQAALGGTALRGEEQRMQRPEVRMWGVRSHGLGGEGSGTDSPGPGAGRSAGLEGSCKDWLGPGTCSGGHHVPAFPLNCAPGQKGASCDLTPPQLHRSASPHPGPSL